MTAYQPAIAYETGVLPEPLAKPAGLIQLLRLLRDNQHSFIHARRLPRRLGRKACAL